MITLKELVFVGLGLNDEKGISLKGLEEAQTADTLFMEFYTSLMPNFSLKNLETLCGRQVQLVTRKNLEEENGKIILGAAQNGKTVFLVPGDPFIATTHVTLRIEAEKQGTKTRIIHGGSIISAIISASGLHNYKFGKTVTVPFQENFSETPYNVIAQNRKLGLHTLCLLDLNAAENRFLTLSEAIKSLQIVEEKRKECVISAKTVAVGFARVGDDSPIVKADYVLDLAKHDFGDPPYSLVIAGELHFMEIEALIALAGAPASFRGLAK